MWLLGTFGKPLEQIRRRVEREEGWEEEASDRDTRV